MKKNILSAKLIKRLKPIVFIASLLPLALLIYQLFTGQIIEPIDEIHYQTGQWAIRFLFISLAITPLVMMTKQNSLILLRRMLGLFSFFYALLHIINYLVLDRNLNVDEIWFDVTDRPYIIVGLLCFIILIALAVTSTNGMIKRLGAKAWKKLHTLVYISGILACLHYLWLVKTINTLSIIYILILLSLLAFRVPRLMKSFS